jgi:hypothetical protein
MGPDDPWSPSWRPDPGGGRIIAIRAMRRGALLAGALFVPIAILAVWLADIQPDLALIAVVVGTAGVALLGAGLAPSALGSRVDAAVAGLALAIGAPVAAVTSMVIAAFIVGVLFGDDGALSGQVMRGGVLVAARVAPLLVLAAAIWVIGVRRGARSTTTDLSRGR